jgi:hypothetical protein
VSHQLCEEDEKKMEKNVKSLALSMVALMVLLALIAPVQAPCLILGHVYNPDGTPAVGAVVTATDLDTGASGTGTTDGLGLYCVTPLPFPDPGDRIRIVATKGDLYAETTVSVPDPLGPMTVDLTLSAALPILSPIGLVALVTMLSALAVLTISRRKRR